MSPNMSAEFDEQSCYATKYLSALTCSQI